eukprot:5036654-Ditylum_brightwellii.AAC.1
MDKDRAEKVRCQNKKIIDNTWLPSPEIKHPALVLTSHTRRKRTHRSGNHPRLRVLRTGKVHPG